MAWWQARRELVDHHCSSKLVFWPSFSTASARHSLVNQLRTTRLMLSHRPSCQVALTSASSQIPVSNTHTSASARGKSPPHTLLMGPTGAEAADGASHVYVWIVRMHVYVCVCVCGVMCLSCVCCVCACVCMCVC